MAESTVPMLVVGHGKNRHRYVLSQQSAEQVERLKDAVIFDDADVRIWLRSKGTTLFGEFFTVTNEDELVRASAWLTEQFHSFLAWRLSKDA